MTTSILNDTLLIKDQPANILQEYLHTINLNIFDDIFHKSQNLEEAKQKILFILTAYSEDSPLLILRQDSKEEKEGICEYLNIPEFLRGNLMTLQEPEVRKATTQYLTQFAGPLFKALMLIFIQLEDLNMAITNREYVVRDDKAKKGEGEIVTITLYDWAQHSKAVQQYELLSKKASALEKEIKQQGTYKAISELKEYRYQNIDKKVNTQADKICIESSKRIRIGLTG